MTLCISATYNTITLDDIPITSLSAMPTPVETNLDSWQIIILPPEYQDLGMQTPAKLLVYENSLGNSFVEWELPSTVNSVSIFSTGVQLYILATSEITVEVNESTDDASCKTTLSASEISLLQYAN